MKNLSLHILGMQLIVIFIISLEISENEWKIPIDYNYVKFTSL